MDTAAEDVFRRALMRQLVDAADNAGGILTRADLTYFRFGDRVWRLIDESRGIRNPVELDATLTIMHNPDGPYRDVEVSPGVWEYAYQKGSEEGSNTKLRRARELHLPVVFLLKHQPDPRTPAVYVPISLAYVIGDDRARRVFTIALEDVALSADPLHPTELERRYAERLVQQRLHQPAFRGAVLFAYGTQCSVCDLDRAPLLDAAHIVGDRHADGAAAVTNGLAMCKLHHAAYDRYLIGITPDREIRVAPKVLAATGGPMLRTALQSFHGGSLRPPRLARDAPDRDRLARRFADFQEAAR